MDGFFSDMADPFEVASPLPTTILPDHTSDESHPYWLPLQNQLPYGYWDLHSGVYHSSEQFFEPPSEFSSQFVDPKDVMGPSPDWYPPSEPESIPNVQGNTNMIVPPLEQQQLHRLSTDAMFSHPHMHQAHSLQQSRPLPPPQLIDHPPQQALPPPSSPPRPPHQELPHPAEQSLTEPERRGRGRPKGSKDTKPRKAKNQSKQPAEAGSSIMAPVKSSEHRVDRRGQLAAGMSKSSGPSTGTATAGSGKKHLFSPAQIGAGTLLTPELSPIRETPQLAEAGVDSQGQVVDSGAVPREPKMVTLDLGAHGRIEKRYMWPSTYNTIA